ncbi:MAG: nuclear transport factor 2 family protein [Bacteroidota bacterium]
MKKLLLISCLFISINFIAKSQTKSEMIVHDLETKRFASLVSKDFDFLDQVFSENLEYLHSNGAMDDKLKYMDGIKSGRVNYLELTPENFATKEYSKNVVINRGKVKIRVKSGTNEGAPFSVYFTTVYLKEKADWKCISWQATRLTN